MATELRRLRSVAGLTREQVRDRTGINDVTLYRIETAHARPQLRTLNAMLALYEVSDEQRANLIDLCKNATAQDWTVPYRDELSAAYSAYLSFENEASALRNYESLHLPGLLQTEDYTRAVIQGGLPTATTDDIQIRAKARTTRQQVLTKENSVSLWAIVDEAALHRVVGGPPVMRDQLTHLANAVTAPHITFQVIPYRVGAHPGMLGPFTVLEFADAEDTDLVYVETIAGDLFAEKDKDIKNYRAMFENLVAVALSPAESATMVEDVANSLKGRRA
ncbi:helix-turn-helix domain-containing protein [Actinophytocola sp.]|uniref:helix-turn-helix domain-containing protein n=1 Tax=Actinophytocola sp. TaxID=1872138 RepID=UPI003D6B929C